LLLKFFRVAPKPLLHIESSSKDQQETYKYSNSASNGANREEAVQFLISI